MNRGHIVELLDRKGLRELSSSERSQIRSHVAHCDSCREVFEAARLNSEILQVRASELAEPSPFFKTRVLSALQAHGASQPPPLALSWIWRTAPGLLSAIVIFAVLLGGATLFSDQIQPVSPVTETTPGLFSPEFVFVERLEADQVDLAEVLSTLYENEEVYIAD